MRSEGSIRAIGPEHGEENLLDPNFHESSTMQPAAPVAGALEPAVDGERRTFMRFGLVVVLPLMVIAACGSGAGGDPVDDVGGADESVVVPEVSSAADELVAGRELFRQVALGPHVYITATIDGGAPQHLYLKYRADGTRSFDPPLDADFLNPFSVHDELLAAIEDERDVAYLLDAASGLPSEWSIDGATRTLSCLQVDTAPPDLRDIACDPAYDLIGQPSS